MGYSKAKTAIERILPLLNELYYKRQTVSLATVDSVGLAYKIREAIHAAGHHKEYEHLTGLRSMYEFRQLPGRVQCSFQGVDPNLVKPLHTTPVTEPAREVVDMKPTEEIDLDLGGLLPADEPQKIQLTEVDSLHGIVGAVLKYGSSHEEIYFPEAQLTTEEKEKLLAWCQSQDEDWGFIDHEEAGLTLTRAVVMEDLLWNGDSEE